MIRGKRYDSIVMDDIVDPVLTAEHLERAAIRSAHRLNHFDKMDIEKVWKAVEVEREAEKTFDRQRYELAEQRRRQREHAELIANPPVHFAPGKIWDAGPPQYVIDKKRQEEQLMRLAEYAEGVTRQMQLHPTTPTLNRKALLLCN